MPIEPPRTSWRLSTGGARPGEDLVGIGADLAPGTVLEAYREGIFPMGVGVGGGPPLGWWSPDPRGIFLPGDLHVSRSLRRSVGRFEATVDTAFRDVVEACADPSRDGAWITPEIVESYVELHRLGWAHSVEVWAEGVLVGGLYGLAIGRLFAAESKFHRATDASKVALVRLVEVLSEDGEPWVLDVQWSTPHLARLGVREVDRSTYLDLVRRVRSRLLPSRWRAGPT
ncbi:leucyl/phenylalanyl-tRNA--protein transferase [Ornithinimicrobium sufpigmenti]|uniref:leucyl/phenylalanyl-tRNA--protein transferase n=1 Tax=Ornithinimicrobium sufpigmenti TaxID=2508882 RepID=UPI001036CECB|nr:MULTISPECIES: leucyl/phenylalanyl-tRNA--protein transferase [unclassified Ornithinimicrobium]